MVQRQQSLRRSRMGELYTACHISRRVNSGNPGLIIFICRDYSFFHTGPDCHFRRKHAFPTGSSPHSYQQPVRRDPRFLFRFFRIRSFFIIAQPAALFHFFHSGYRRFCMDIHPSFFQNHFQVLGNLLIHAGKDSVHSLQDSDLFAQITVKLGKLHSNHSAANNNQMIIEAFPGKNTGAVFYSRRGNTGNRKHGRLGACRNQNMTGCKTAGLSVRFRCNHYAVFFCYHGFSLIQSDFIFLKLQGDSLLQCLDHFLLTLMKGCPV